MLTIFTYILTGTLVWGATPYKQGLDKKLNAYITEGVYTGGTITTPLSLLTVRRHYAEKAQVERIFLDLGNAIGEPLKNGVGHYHVGIEKNPSRIVVDLNQVQSSGVSEEQLRKIFEKSAFVKVISLRFDPEEKVTTMVLEMKKPVGVEVVEMPSNTKASRLVIDVKSIKK